jgi:pimeloyl-ACP methyl ester carboxylesterase
MIRTMLASLALAIAVPASAQEPATAAPDYSKSESWLCLPGRDDVCAKPLPTTALNANGYGSVGQALPASDPKIDCFYVYPTVSRDAGDNSDMTAGPEEQATAAVQFARFAGTCRTFAPLYRQATLTALLRQARGEGQRTAQSIALAYGDVLAAWREYLGTHNKGRPFVLIGHSQGTIHLTQLLAREIEGKPEAKRMLSALLIGFNVEVPEGKIVGGTFKETPLCARVGETGCVVSYVSFRATNPPPPVGALFGRTARPGMTVACTNPARLAKNSAPLDSYWYGGPAVTSTPSTIAWSSQGTPPTPFLRTDGLATAACVNRGNVGYLSVMVNADPADARTDQIPGDVAIGGAVQPGWGLHLADMNLAMGDLIALVEAQAAAYRR